MTLKLPSALQSFKGSTSLFFSCVSGYNFTVWLTVTIVIALFLVAAGSCFQQKYYKSQLYITCTFQNRGQEGNASKAVGEMQGGGD